MDKFISELFNRKEAWIKFLFYIFDAIISILSIILIPNKLLSAIFILGILIINASTLFKDKINKKILINKKTKIFFLFFLFALAVTPALFGIFIEKADVLELVFGNMIANILGALIVFSFINHMSEFNYTDFVVNILKTDYILESIVKVFYYFCFFNSLNFFLNENWKWTNIINNIYLFIVILSGLILGCSFFYRIFIDDKPFDFSPKKVYPTKTLWCGAAYLISCSLPSFFIEVKIQPVLLLLNTMTAFIVALALLYFVIRKSKPDSVDYPFAEFGLFSLIIFLNCYFYIVHYVEDIENIFEQLISGGGILSAVIIVLIILNKKIKK